MGRPGRSGTVGRSLTAMGEKEMEGDGEEIGRAKWSIY